MCADLLNLMTLGGRMAASSPDVLSGRDGACIAAAPPKHTLSLNTSSAPQATAPRTARSDCACRQTESRWKRYFSVQAPPVPFAVQAGG